MFERKTLIPPDFAGIVSGGHGLWEAPITASFQAVNASPALAPVLCGAWELTADGGGPPDMAAPDGCPELVVHLSGGVRRSLNGASLDDAGYALVQPVTGGLLLEQCGRIHIRALRFQPSGIFALGGQASAMRNLAVNPAEILGDAAQAVEAALMTAHSLAAALRQAEHHLARRLRESGRQTVFTAAILSRLAAERGDAALERMTGWTARHARRLMLNETGHTPGEYQRLSQFHRARRLITETGLSLSEIAARTGYVDQAHMTRRVKAYAGLTPRQLRRSISVFGPLHALGEGAA